MTLSRLLPTVDREPDDGSLSSRLTGVAYDARYLTERPTGIGHVCLELLRGLAALEEQPPLRVLVNPQTPIPDDLKWRSQLTFETIPWGPRGVASQVFLPRYLPRNGIRLLHGVDGHNPVFALGTKLIVTVHDLIPLTFRPGFGRSIKARHRRTWKTWLRWQCRRAQKVVCVSGHTASELIEVLGVDPAKVVVIPNPVREWPTVQPAEALRRQLGLVGPFISYVGRQDPHKNLVPLIRSLPILNRLLGRRRVQLVVAGRLDARYPEAIEEARSLGLGDQVLFSGYLDEKSLGALYQFSDVFVFPSLSEGFGMPPVEAMRFGTPVVAGRRASLPEVLGDAALYVDTEVPEAIARGVFALLRDARLAERVRQAGFRQARRFSRDRAARTYYQLYREVLLEGTATSPPPGQHTTSFTRREFPASSGVRSKPTEINNRLHRTGPAARSVVPKE